MIFLLFGDVAFVGFWWMFLVLGSYARASHTPQPLSRGEILDAAFFLEMSGLCSF